MRQLEVQKEDHELATVKLQRKREHSLADLTRCHDQALREKDSVLNGVTFNLEEKLEQALASRTKEVAARKKEAKEATKTRDSLQKECNLRVR